MRNKTDLEIMIEERQRKEFEKMFNDTIDKKTKDQEIEELKKQIVKLNKENTELKEMIDDLECEWNEQEEEIERLKKENNKDLEQFCKYYVLKDLINYYQRVSVLDEHMSFYEAAKIRIQEVLNEEEDFYTVYKVSKEQVEKIKNEILKICMNFKYKQLLENIKLVVNTYTHF